MTTIMQPVQCDLQPRFKKRIELRTQEQPLVAEHRGGTKTTAAAPATHRRYLSSPPAATLHGKMQGLVSCSGFLPNTSGHHFPSPPLPFLTTSLRHHFPRSPLPFVTTLCHSLLFSCDVSLCDVKSHTALHQCQVSQFYLSVTRKYCFPTSFENHLSLSS